MIPAFLFCTAFSLLSPVPMPNDTIPDPQTVAADEVPEAVVQSPGSTDTTATFYYLIFDGRSERFDEDDPPEQIVRALLDKDLPLEAAWAPIPSSVKVPCMAPNVYPAFVVKLKTPDEAIGELDFTADLEHINPNCGIEQFDRYVFD